MARLKRLKPEQIIHQRREADVLIGQGLSTLDACRRLEVVDQICCRWRKEYGGMKVDQAKRLLADAELDLAIHREAASPKRRTRRVGSC